MSDMMSENASWSTSTSLTAGAVTAVSQQAVQGAVQTGCCSGQLQGYDRSNLTTSLNALGVTIDPAFMTTTVENRD